MIIPKICISYLSVRFAYRQKPDCFRVVLVFFEDLMNVQMDLKESRQPSMLEIIVSVHTAFNVSLQFCTENKAFSRFRNLVYLLVQKSYSCYSLKEFCNHYLWQYKNVLSWICCKPLRYRKENKHWCKILFMIYYDTNDLLTFLKNVVRTIFLNRTDV